MRSWRRWRRATAPSMSTARLAPAATARRCSPAPGAGSSASTATPRRCDAVQRSPAQHPGRLTVIEGRFGDMERLVVDAAPGPIAGVALDLGVSSMQLDQAERGFSFRLDGPLDMRMGRAARAPPNSSPACRRPSSAELIRSLGEERYARRVARAIVAARRENPIGRTGELADIVRGAIPSREPGLDSATRTFQALRIAVNDELGELDRGLAGAERLLMPGGRLAVVAFHSLEDARVKSFLRRAQRRRGAVSRHMRRPRPARRPPSFRLLHAPGGAARRRGDRAQSARPLGPAARRRAHIGAAMGSGGAEWGDEVGWGQSAGDNGMTSWAPSSGAGSWWRPAS